LRGSILRARLAGYWLHFACVFPPFDGKQRGDISKTKSGTTGVDEQLDVIETIPSKPAKDPSDPFDGKKRGDISKLTSVSTCVDKQGNVTETIPAKPSKAPFDPFVGKSTKDISENTTVTRDLPFPNTYHSEPSKHAKGVFGDNDPISEHSTDQFSFSNTYRNAPTKPAKLSADGSLRQSETLARILNEPDSPTKTCTCCGSGRWWWDGFGAWCCDRCLADVHGHGGHHKTGEGVMHLTV